MKKLANKTSNPRVSVLDKFKVITPIEIKFCSNILKYWNKKKNKIHTTSGYLYSEEKNRSKCYNINASIFVQKWVIYLLKL